MWVSEENIFFAEKNSNEVSLFKNGEMVKDSLERTQAATNIDLVLYFFGSLLSSLTLQEKKFIWANKKFWILLRFNCKSFMLW